MKMIFDAVYYEPAALEYPLGKELQQKYYNLPWIEIQSHNRIPELAGAENKEFTKLKQHLIVGIRKTHKYVENHKVSDWIVPYTSSGCRAMCLYCYLVCNYNKCSYLRIFVNREQMFNKLLKSDTNAPVPQTFEIGSNSDLILENVVTGNLTWTIERFGKEGRGHITFPTKFNMVEPLLKLDHNQKTIFRMSVNPTEIIRQVEIGTSPLEARIKAANQMSEAGYPVGLLIAPIILVPEWRQMYTALLETLSDTLCPQIKQTGFIEIIFMTYSFVHNAINTDAFPNRPTIFDSNLMTGRGRGKYCYRNDVRQDATIFLEEQIKAKLGMNILYIV